MVGLTLLAPKFCVMAPVQTSKNFYGIAITIAKAIPAAILELWLRSARISKIPYPSFPSPKCVPFGSKFVVEWTKPLFVNWRKGARTKWGNFGILKVVRKRTACTEYLHYVRACTVDYFDPLFTCCNGKSVARTIPESLTRLWMQLRQVIQG